MHRHVLASFAFLALTLAPPYARAADEAADTPIRRFRPERGMVELGAFGGAFVFSRTHDLYDPATAPSEPLRRPTADLGVRAAYFPLSFLGVEAEFSALPATYDPGGKAFIYGVRAHGILQLPFYRVVPFFDGGYGLMGVRSSQAVAGNDVDPVGHYGGGVKFFVNRYLALRVDARHFVGAQAAEQRDGTSHFQALLGVSFTLGRAKPKAADPEPEPTRDRDADGFLDDADRCPEEPGVAPDGCPERDSDGDSFLDGADLCPTVPGVAPDGCPPKDGDRDGFLDADDACPAEPGVAPDGCPIRDRDGDRILDPDDRCPDAAETRNGFEDTDGCPDELPPAVKRSTGVIRGIFFDFNSETIRARSRPTLDAAAKILVEYPDIRIEIIGHTDDVGGRAYNLDLSRRRAESVRAYLIGRGLGAERVTTRGAGPDEPLSDNSSARGRAENRRIEFRVITE